MRKIFFFEKKKSNHKTSASKNIDHQVFWELFFSVYPDDNFQVAHLIFTSRANFVGWVKAWNCWFFSMFLSCNNFKLFFFSWKQIYHFHIWWYFTWNWLCNLYILYIFFVISAFLILREIKKVQTTLWKNEKFTLTEKSFVKSILMLFLVILLENHYFHSISAKKELFRETRLYLIRAGEKSIFSSKHFMSKIL